MAGNFKNNNPPLGFFVCFTLFYPEKHPLEFLTGGGEPKHINEKVVNLLFIFGFSATTCLKCVRK